MYNHVSLCSFVLSAARAVKARAPRCSSTPSALILVSNNILQKKEPVPLGEMADFRAGAGSKEVLEKVRETERGGERSRREKEEREWKGKGRKKNRKQKPNSHYLSREIKVNINSIVTLMAVTLDEL